MTAHINWQQNTGAFRLTRLLNITPFKMAIQSDSETNADSFSIFAARRSYSFHSSNCHRINVGRAETLFQPAKCLKTVRDRLYVSMAANRNTYSGYGMRLCPTPASPSLLNRGVESTPSKFSAKRLEIEEAVCCTAHLRTH